MLTIICLLLAINLMKGCLYDELKASNGTSTDINIVKINGWPFSGDALPVTIE